MSDGNLESGGGGGLIYRGLRIMNEGGLSEWGISPRGPGGKAPLLGTPKDMLKRYTKTDVKMPCKWVSLSIGAPLGNLEGIHLPGLFERKG